MIRDFRIALTLHHVEDESGSLPIGQSGEHVECLRKLLIRFRARGGGGGRALYQLEGDRPRSRSPCRR